MQEIGQHMADGKQDKDTKRGDISQPFWGKISLNHRREA